MTFKIINVNDLQIISCLTCGEDETLIFYCHDKRSDLSYSEKMPLAQILQRIRQLNKRVHFPTRAVRIALCSADPVEASLCNTPTEDVDAAAAAAAAAVVKKEQQAENEQQGVGVGDGEGKEEKGKEKQEQPPPPTLLNLKYRIEGAPAPLKWQWNLQPVETSLFYRCALKDALLAATYLNQNVQYLVEVVRKKDIELKQYRIEGAQLRRSTVVTEPFDVEDFQIEHKQMMADVAAYEQVRQVLVGAPPPAAVIKEESPAGTSKSAEVASTIPCSSTATDSTKTISPRNRKRKAMESGIQHVERKVMQRRRVPQLQYKDSESQEDNIDACVEDDKDIVKIEEVEELELISEDDIKLETTIEIAATADHEDNANGNNELDEIMKLINRTAEQTNKMLEENKHN